MALEYGFYNSINGDRKYGANDFSRIFDGMIRDGVFEHYGSAFMVTPGGSGLTVVIGTGKAWFEHTWNILDTPYTMTLEAASTIYPRIDAVVLETNAESRTNSFTIVKGTPAAAPGKPALSSTQHPLAYVTVPTNAVSIASADVEVVVGQSATPFVDGLLNMVDITPAFQQWKAQFDNWFNNLVYVLDGDVAGHLQNQINQNRSAIEQLAPEWNYLGTILSTPKVLTSDKWRLANGDTIYDTSYPEYVEEFGALYYKALTGLTTSLSTIACEVGSSILYSQYSSSNGYSLHMYPDAPLPPHVPEQLPSAVYRLDGMWYANGEVVYLYHDSNATPHVYYSKFAPDAEPISIGRGTPYTDKALGTHVPIYISGGSSYTSLSLIDISSGTTIVTYPTQIATNTIIREVYTDAKHNKFYAGFANSSGANWKIYRMEMDSTLTFIVDGNSLDSTYKYSKSVAVFNNVVMFYCGNGVSPTEGYRYIFYDLETQSIIPVPSSFTHSSNNHCWTPFVNGDILVWASNFSSYTVPDTATCIVYRSATNSFEEVLGKTLPIPAKGNTTFCGSRYIIKKSNESALYDSSVIGAKLPSISADGYYNYVRVKP